MQDVSVSNVYFVQILLHYLKIVFLVSDAIVCNLCGSYGTDYADLKIFMKNIFKILLISFEYK